MKLKVANSDVALLSAGSICVRLLVHVFVCACERACACICVCMRLRECAFACACVCSSMYVYAGRFSRNDTNLERPSLSDRVRVTVSMCQSWSVIVAATEPE